jgi:DNA repair exonuclease SbcCD ATPase subunit
VKLSRLEVEGFRAFSGAQVFDLSADAIVLVGANGQGKTSIFDAILWALTGRIPRLTQPEAVVSMWSTSGEARVVLELTDHEEGGIQILRTSTGSEDQLFVRTEAGGDFRGEEARPRLLRLFWPQALAAAKPYEALEAAMQRSVYLQQDLVRAFIEADNDQKRFSAVSELVGAGRVTELQLALERARTAWTRATNVQDKELSELKLRLDDVRTQLEALRHAIRNSQSIDGGGWGSWWKEVSRLGVQIPAPPTPASGDAPTALDAAVKQLQTLVMTNRRRQDAAAALLEEIGTIPAAPPQVDRAVLEEHAKQAEEALKQAQTLLTQVEEQTAEVRRQQTQLRDQKRQLQAFAELALQHLGDRCPVCEQTYDQEATRARLKALAHGTDEIESSGPDTSNVSTHAVFVQERERDLALVRSALREGIQKTAEWNSLQASLRDRLAALGVSELTRDTERGLGSIVADCQGVAADLERAISSGEKLSLVLAQEGQRARALELERELTSLSRQVEEREKDVSQRRKTGELTESLLNGLREAASDLVDAELARIEPLFKWIYAAADPHPALRDPYLTSHMTGGHGRLVASLKDPLSELSTDAPEVVLSSSQLNVLAVAVFLSLNLGMRALPLGTAILDDPLQSLDDVNLLGLVDVLRRTRESRQLLVSTHDPQFGSLLGRKLRPVREGQRTLVYELEGWSREGPIVVATEIPRDEKPLRIAA